MPPPLVLKVAVTVWSELIVTVQVPVPEHPPPDHPPNVDPLFGVAVSLTWVPALKPFEQSTPQAIPAGLLLTPPDPVPAFSTVNVWPVNGSLQT